MSLDREVTGHTSRQDLDEPPPGRPAQAADPVAIGAQCKGPVGAPPPPARRQTLAPWPAKVPEGSTCTARGRKRALQSTAEEGASHAATRAGGAWARRAGRPRGPGRPAAPRSWRPHAGARPCPARPTVVAACSIPHCGQWSHTVESSLRRLALCPAVGTAHCEVMELASKLWSWAQLHNLEFQKSPTAKFWSWAGFCQGRLCQQCQGGSCSY